MKEVYWDSLSLPKGARVRIFETVEEGDTAAGKSGAILDASNSYMVQKGPLVWFRSDYLDLLLQVTGYERPTETVTKKDKEGKETKSEVPLNTEKTDIDKIESMLAIGKLTVKAGTYEIVSDASESKENPLKYTVTVGTFSSPSPDLDKARDAVKSWAQGLVDQMGPYEVDIKERARVSKEKKPPQKAIEAATRLLDNGTYASRWQAVFAKDLGRSYDLTNNRDADITGIAWLVKEHIELQAKSYS